MGPSGRWGDGVGAGGAPATHDLPLLVGRAAAGDADAWEALYRRCYGKLYTFARRRSCDDQAAEDAVSETMTRALHAIGRFTWQGGGFDAWLYGIARNVIRESNRTRWRTPAVAATPDRICPERGPEEQAIVGDDDAAMRLAFGRLDDGDRELLELRVHAGLSAHEVGRLLGKRPGAVRMAQARALQRLRANLEAVRGG